MPRRDPRYPYTHKEGKKMGRPKIGALATDVPLTLKRYPNGGWVVSQCPGDGSPRYDIGAYGSVEDMLAALRAALSDPTKEAP